MQTRTKTSIDLQFWDREKERDHHDRHNYDNHNGNANYVNHDDHYDQLYDHDHPDHHDHEDHDHYKHRPWLRRQHKIEVLWQVRETKSMTEKRDMTEKVLTNVNGFLEISYENLKNVFYKTYHSQKCYNLLRYMR